MLDQEETGSLLNDLKFGFEEQVTISGCELDDIILNYVLLWFVTTSYQQTKCKSWSSPFPGLSKIVLRRHALTSP